MEVRGYVSRGFDGEFKGREGSSVFIGVRVFLGSGGGFEDRFFFGRLFFCVFLLCR